MTLSTYIDSYNHLTRQTFVGKVMSLLFNVLSRLVMTLLPRSKHLLNLLLQAPSAVILEPRKIKSATVFTSICREVMGPDAMILVFWMLSFKPVFSLSSFTFIKRLFSSSSLSVIRVVSSAYLRLLIFLPAILIPACASSSPALLLGRKVMTNLESILKSRDITLPTKVCLVKAMVFPVVMYGCESWTIKKAECWRIWLLWTVLLEKTLESPLDCKEIQPVHPKGDQSWVFIGRTDAEAETPILWPPHAKSWLIGKDPDAGRDWGQEEKGTTEDEIVWWHHQLDGHVFGWTPGVGGQGGLECCDSEGRKESDMTERLNWTEPLNTCIDSCNHLGHVRFM